MWHWAILLSVVAWTPDQKQEAQYDILRWGGIIGAVVIIGGALLMAYRAKFMNKEQPKEEIGFGLSDLKSLRDQGELTIQEYEAAREKIAAKTKEKAGLVSGEYTLPQIRDMLDNGSLTAVQYETERKKIIERLKGRS